MRLVRTALFLAMSVGSSACMGITDVIQVDDAGVGGGGGGGATGGGSATGGGGLVTRGGPVLFFSDLASGPRSGNSDASAGQPANENGVFVSVWGKNLGATQGTSTVTVGGQSAQVLSWGPAVHGADLSRRLGLQLVEFQVPASAPLGATDLQVTVGGASSNTLPFTTRSGAVHFVAPNGNDTATGSFTAPWRTFAHAVDAMANGDVVYLKAGVYGPLQLSASGSASLPRAVVAYPGAQVVIGGTACENTGHPLIHNWSPAENGGSLHWVIAKLTVRSPDTCEQDSAVTLADGYRLIGNSLSTPRTSDGCQSGTVQCGGLGSCGDDLFVLGNELGDSQTVNAATGSKQCHGFYISGNRQTAGLESHRDIGWNYVHDCANNRAINIYNESYNGASAPRAQIERHLVHDNWVENQRGVGLLMGADITGDNWVFNNVFLNTGLGPEFADGGGFFPFQLNPGSSVPVRATRLFVFNNLIHGASFPGGPDYAVGLVNWGQGNLVTLDFRNNVVIGTENGVRYVNQYSDTFMSTFNLWAGAGLPPTGATMSLNTAPQFVNAATFDFHLVTGSAGQGQGTDLSSLGVGLRDFDGVPRIGAWSMGPFQ